jgi:signal transduction histidine kinase
MKEFDFQNLDRSVARARILLSLLAMLSLYVDPTTVGGLFHLTTLALATLLCHLAYSLSLYLAIGRRLAPSHLPAISASLDLFFAAAIALLTQGQSGPSYVFFLFAIVAAGMRNSPRPTLMVTAAAVTLYLAAVALSGAVTNLYLMQAVYLAIAGYLIGFVGRQRVVFEARLRELETAAERQSIARSLHDGYIQALAGVNLRLESCRELIARGRAADALAEVTDLQMSVAREYDEVRAYIRSLVGIEESPTREIGARKTDPNHPRMEVEAAFASGGFVGEHILQIMLEALRNSRRHAMASVVAIKVMEDDDRIAVTIDDDGVGFADSQGQPWAIASRVAELGGHLNISRDGPAHLEIELPKI